MNAEPGAVRPDIPVELLKKGLALVRARAAARWHPNAANLTEAELVSIGTVVLYERGPAFAEARGVQFTTYLFPYVDGAMLSALRDAKQESRLERAIVREAQAWSSTLTDQFDIFYNTREETRESLHEKARALASRLVTTVVAEASRDRGSEQHAAELQAHAVACATMHQTIGAMDRELQQLWSEHYQAEKTLVQIAKETGVPEIMMRRRKQRFEDEVFEALYARGVTEMPRVR